jgi:transcriptional regulator with XRE-family HTH domain
MPGTLRGVATVDLDDQARRRLAAAVRNRRTELHLSQATAATRGGLSVATLNRIENGKAGSLSTGTLAGLDEAMAWQTRRGDDPGSAELVILGGSALPADHPRAIVTDNSVVVAIEEVDDDELRRRWLAAWDRVRRAPDAAEAILTIVDRLAT